VPSWLTADPTAAAPDCETHHVAGCIRHTRGWERGYEEAIQHNHECAAAHLSYSSCEAKRRTAEEASAPPPPPGTTPTTPPEGGEEGEDQVGSRSHAGDQKFCEEHQCIGSFESEPGTVAECNDGTFSHSGGIQGACSHHEGVRRD
jgi:hypothetical protein